MTSDAQGPGGLTYAQAGVDIDAGNALVARIAPAVRATERPGAMGGIGGFGALFDPRAAGFADPILVAATDGVGTKLRIGIETGALAGLGQDLVAMCVNDLACQGAEPLLFLDYFATGSLDVDAAAQVIEGIAAACRIAGCVLAGGETAEMPGLYAPGDFDLAGFALGAMERGAGLPAGVAAGDVALGLCSEGVHSNGFSLVREVVARAGLSWADPAPFGAGSLGQELLTPTRIYAPALLAAIRSGGVRAAAHVTGGGLSENLPRVLPAGLGCTIDLAAWALPPVFGWLREEARLADADLLRTFNAGIGMVLIVAPERAEALGALLMQQGERVVPLGRVESGQGVRYRGRLE